MKPALGDHLFYTAPDDSGIKPGPYPCIVTSACGTTIVAFGAGRACAQIFDVAPSELSADPTPYKAKKAQKRTAKPPGVSTAAKAPKAEKAAKKSK